MTNLNITLIVLFIIVPVLAAILLGLNLLLAVHNPYEEKVSAYECGYDSLSNQTRTAFSIHFITVAMLFLVFDVELVLAYPLALTLYQINFYGFTVAMIFFIVLTIGFVLEIGSGAIALKNVSVKTKN